jgi:hypothetical protein
MCEHENFRADVAVNRLLDSKSFIAEIRIKCLDCDISFSFPPLPLGLSCHEARLNLDGTVLRLPLKPVDQSAFNAFAGFNVHVSSNQGGSS